MSTRYLLSEDAIPTHWVNVLPDLPRRSAAAAEPGTMEPAGPDDLAPIFPIALIEQEVSPEPLVAIPDAGPRRLPPVAPDAAAPRPALERALETPAKIYYKYEGVSPAGSAQAQHRRRRRPTPTREAGISKLATETGAGQWGSALAFACSHVRPGVRGLDGRLQLRPEALPALDDADVGRDGAPLAERPHAGRPRQAAHPTGSLGIAISEAVEVAAQAPGTNYALGSVLNHVLPAPDGDRPGGDRPDGARGRAAGRGVGCVGGGSNFGRHRLPVPARGAAGRRVTRASSPPSPPPARRSPAASTATTSATPWG